MALTQVQPGMLASDSQYTGFKNRIINGACVIAQRGTSLLTQNASDYQYPVDRFGIFGSVTSKFTSQQSSTAPTGFNNSIVCTSSSAYTVGAGESFVLQQFIEGYNVADLGWGTANAKTVTLSFWVRSSLTGTFGGAFSNSAVNRSYPFTYTISVADTWEYKTVTVAGDTSGTWLTTNGLGIRLWFNLGAGSTLSGTAGAWAGADYRSATGATSVVGTNGATFYITGVQLEKGSTATSFDYRPYGIELNLCQRYFWRRNGAANVTFGAGTVFNTTDIRALLYNPVVMRANPSITFTGTDFAYANSGSTKTLSSLNAADQSPEVSLLYSGAGTTASTQGQGALWLITSANSYISVSAEL